MDDKELISRKEFLRRSLGLITALAIPSFLERCAQRYRLGTSGGDIAPGTDYISFEITFSDAIDRDSFARSLSIDPSVDASGAPAYEWSAGDTVVYCEFLGTVKGALYTVTVGAATESASGLSLDGNGDGIGGDPYTFTVPSVTA